MMLLFPLRSVWGLDGIMPNDSVALMVACDDNAGFVWICVWVRWSRMPSHAASIASYLIE